MMERKNSRSKHPRAEVHDLNSSIRLLESKGQLIRSREPVDPFCELAAVYKLIGAGTPAQPPTRTGPAVLFENVKNSDLPVIAGVLASRERAALLLGSTTEGVARVLLKALKNPLQAVVVARKAPCHEVIHRPPLDIMKILPVPTSTELDAGPYFTMGLLRAEDPETGEADVTIHRLCVQGPDLLTASFVPGRHIGHFRTKAENMGEPLPVSINIGLDPAIYIAACFEPPATPLGFDELGIAGAIRAKSIELVNCVSVKAKAIAHAEIVIEGEILPGERMREDFNTNQGYAMPEFAGYLGKSQPELPVIKIKAITHRRKAILQTLVTPGEEHCNLAGIPTEAGILSLVEESMPGRLMNVYAHPAGGGKLLAIMQFKKTSSSDEGRQRQAALTAFAAFSELKHVILVDEDVNLFDSQDVLWALTTRYQGDISTVLIPGVRCHSGDPSQSPEFSHTASSEGITCKTIFDCTVPYALKKRFARPAFKQVDVERFLKK